MLVNSVIDSRLRKNAAVAPAAVALLRLRGLLAAASVSACTASGAALAAAGPARRGEYGAAGRTVRRRAHKARSASEAFSLAAASC